MGSIPPACSDSSPESGRVKLQDADAPREGQRQVWQLLSLTKQFFKKTLRFAKSPNSKIAEVAPNQKLVY